VSAVKVVLFALGVVVAALGYGVKSAWSIPLPAKPDKLLLVKSERMLYLLRDGDVVGSYPVSLGRTPKGPKIFEGDGRTPEGLYVIDQRNPSSRFFRSLHISYPNAEDFVRARRYGVSAGGLVMIHGQPADPRSGDWTEGCIALTNAQMEEIWSLVDVGTPIEIIP
jgi:murein L,D-transpeptidase YafK